MHLAFRSALTGTLRDRRIEIWSKEGAVVVVDINYLVTSKVHGVGVERPGAAEEFGMKHLQGQRFPPAGGASGENARIGLANDAELFLQVGNQFGHDRVAVGAIVGGVYGVRVVIVDGGVLKGDGDHAREICRGPALVKLYAGQAALARS